MIRTDSGAGAPQTMADHEIWSALGTGYVLTLLQDAEARLRAWRRRMANLTRWRSLPCSQQTGPRRTATISGASWAGTPGVTPVPVTACRSAGTFWPGTIPARSYAGI